MRVNLESCLRRRVDNRAEKGINVQPTLYAG